MIQYSSNMRPFTTTGSSRRKPLADIEENRPKTAFQSKTEMKLPKLKPKSGSQLTYGDRKPLVDNYVVRQSQVNGSNSLDDTYKSNASTPRSALSRSSSKRKLLRRTPSWRIGSVTSEDIGLDDSVSVVNGENNQPLSAWDEFETHIRQVNDSALLMEFDEKSLDFKCSDAFKRIMTELGPKKIKKVEKRLSYPAIDCRNNGVFDEADENDESEEEEDDLGDVPGENDHENRRRRRASRAWGLIRRHIQEIRVERRMAAGSINWDFLRQTISALSDMERARQELYEKYIYKPNWWADGLTKCPEHLVRKYRNSGPLLPPVTEMVHSRDTKEHRQSRPSTSMRSRSNTQSSWGTGKRSSLQDHGHYDS